MQIQRRRFYRDRFTRASQRTTRRRRRDRRPHCGAVLVEFCVTFPVLLLLFFGFWEYSRVEVARQTAAIAAYEGARQGMVAGANEIEIEELARKIMKRADVRDLRIQTRIDDDNSSVAIAVPMRDNLYISPFFFGDVTVKAEFTLPRERFQ